MLVSSCMMAYADTVDDVRALIDNANYEEAIAAVRAELKAKPKSKQAGTLNALAGEAAYRLGNNDEAEAFFAIARQRGVADAYLFSGRIAMHNYDFEKATEMYAKYIELKEKAGKDIDKYAPKELKQSELASEMLERVEKITVIDRIDDVEASSLKILPYISLSPESGKLLEIEDIQSDYPDIDLEQQALSPVFENERGDFRLWAMSNDVGEPLRIVESNRFIGGGWERPIAADSVLNDGGTAQYPFMMADGTTLYFASDGEGSIGGLDIFRSNRDASDASYMAPSNLGMPFNSPGNDYMLVIDESKGIGWWVSDRNYDSDHLVSIYVFVPQEVRENYDIDTPDLASFARLDNIEATQEQLTDDEIDELRIKAAEKIANPSQKGDFKFMISPTVTYRKLSDFKNMEAMEMMEQYLDESTEYATEEARLKALRRQYTDNNSIGNEIRQLELRQEKALEALRQLRGRIIAAERGL